MASIDRFTQRARKVLSLAHKEAIDTHASLIGTEHILIGLLLVEGSTAGKVLHDLDLDADQIREVLKHMREENPDTEVKQPTHKDDILSDEVQEILKQALIEASKADQVYVSTEHLLLSLINANESKAIAILRQLGIIPEQIRKQLKRVLDESASAPVKPKPQEPELKQERRQRPAKSSANSPLIDQLATDLTAKAAAGKLDRSSGR